MLYFSIFQLMSPLIYTFNVWTVCASSNVCVCGSLKEFHYLKLWLSDKSTSKWFYYKTSMQVCQSISTWSTSFWLSNGMMCVNVFVFVHYELPSFSKRTLRMSVTFKWCKKHRALKMEIDTNTQPNHLCKVSKANFCMTSMVLCPPLPMLTFPDRIECDSMNIEIIYLQCL